MHYYNMLAQLLTAEINAGVAAVFAALIDNLAELAHCVTNKF